MIYLDATAVVKLVHAETETPALRTRLDERADTAWISSVLVEVESFRALARYAPSAVSLLPAILDRSTSSACPRESGLWLEPPSQYPFGASMPFTSALRCTPALV